MDFHNAIVSGNYELFKKLFEECEDLYLRNNEQIPILEITLKLMTAVTIGNGNKDICKLLIEKGADVNYKDRVKRTPLICASINNKNKKDICELLIEKGADVNAKDNFGDNPLMFAAMLGSKEICELLIINGADVNYIDDKCETSPLWYASRNGSKEICELLIEKGADVNHHLLMISPLIQASISNQFEVCKLLIAKGANVNAKTDSGFTSLLFASNLRNKEICKLLIDKGANVNSKTNTGFSSLMLAAKKGYNEICELLIANGAEVPELNKDIIESFIVDYESLKSYKKEFDKAKIISKMNQIKEELIAYVWNPERAFTQWALMDEFKDVFGEELSASGGAGIY